MGGGEEEEEEEGGLGLEEGQPRKRRGDPLEGTIEEVCGYGWWEMYMYVSNRRLAQTTTDRPVDFSTHSK